MRRRIVILSIMTLMGIFLSNKSLATHIRAGDLVLERIQTADPSVRRYKVIVTLYRDTGGIEAQDGLVSFGDGTPDVIVSPVSIGTIPGFDTEVLRYETEHTFPSNGVFNISYFERNRNEGVRNMFASGQTPFYIVSTVLINPSLGFNKSPVMQIAPIDEACVGQQFVHNPGAFDFEGDSLSYEMTICKQSGALNVVDYNFPDGFGTEQEDGTQPDLFFIDPITGTLTWNAPGQPGEYNVAFYVNEWRIDRETGQRIRIGRINRDMQIIVRDCNNERPRLNVKDTCIVVNQQLIDTVKATDSDGDVLELTIEKHIPDNTNTTNRSIFRDITNTPAGTAKGIFEWTPTCEDVQKEYYQAIFKAKEVRTDGFVALSDIQVWRIKVIAPAPEGLASSANQVDASISLNWDSYSCPNAEFMQVWRRKGSFDFPPDTCNPGIPAGSGYELIGSVPIGQTTYLDDNEGAGLERGATYCYRLVAIFPETKKGESLASLEVCEFVESIAPYMLEVSVTETDPTNGEIDLTWTKPVNIDVTLFPKPWTYQLVRYEGQAGTDGRVLLPTIYNEQDTVLKSDTGLDTENLAYSYQVLFFSNGTLIDSSQTASSVRLTPNSAPNSITLSWEANVPWNNRDGSFPYHYIYREEPRNSGDFILYDSTDVQLAGLSYTDNGTILPLADSLEYCYYVTTIGSYNQPFLRDSLPNNSQIACAQVLDSIPPCPPLLNLIAEDCSELQKILPSLSTDTFNLARSCEGLTEEMELTWTLQAIPGCENLDIVSYNLYKATNNSDTATFTLFREGLTDLNTVIDSLGENRAGCYYITAIDDFGNESDPSNITCLENCPFYELPNSFSPNGDLVNDLFIPYRCPRFVRKVEFKVYNRWGDLVHKSDDDIYLRWNGTNTNGSKLPTGVYYYSATIHFISLQGPDEIDERNGTIHLFKEKK